MENGQDPATSTDIEDAPYNSDPHIHPERTHLKRGSSAIQPHTPYSSRCQPSDDPMEKDILARNSGLVEDGADGIPNEGNEGDEGYDAGLSDGEGYEDGADGIPKKGKVVLPDHLTDSIIGRLTLDPSFLSFRWFQNLRYCINHMQKDITLEARDLAHFLKRFCCTSPGGLSPSNSHSPRSQTAHRNFASMSLIYEIDIHKKFAKWTVAREVKLNSIAIHRFPGKELGIIAEKELKIYKTNTYTAFIYALFVI
ncbi:hypothetical protein BDZ45DRAFT_721499 [Acephala macrosclerotiorum]|nr:hypothetical protein BDZ45DRAFT_721499 [Acephala macrosclerotiorum]